MRVKDWGTGAPDDLGNLQMAAPLQTYAAGESLYEFLARQLEALQAEGVLEVARPKGTPPPPPFSQWAFAQPHYLQYLTDLYTVHSALESSLQQASNSIESYSTSGSGTNESVAQLVVHMLGPHQELARSQAIKSDIASILSTSTSSSSTKENNNFTVLPQVPQEGQEMETETEDETASPNAAAYAQRLRRLGTQCTQSEDEQEFVSNCLKLAAHVYVVTLTLLTAGARVGAAATEKMNLFARNAVAVFQEYPELAEDSALKVFRKNVDALGKELSVEEQDVVLRELPIAMRSTAVLLHALAKEM